MFIKYFFFFFKNSRLSPLPRQHSAAIGCTKKYQPIGMTVHSHCVESFEILLQRCRRGRGCSKLWKNTIFPEHPVGHETKGYSSTECFIQLYCSDNVTWSPRSCHKTTLSKQGLQITFLMLLVLIWYYSLQSSYANTTCVTVNERIRQWPVTDIGGWPLVNESSRNEIKRIVSKNWNASPILYISTRGAAVQITWFFISRRIIYERPATNIRDWSLA